MTTLVSGGKLLARALVQAGHGEVFALHGGHLDEFLLAAQAAGIKIVDTRHEAAAVHAADGYARSTGRTGISVVTSGPGVTNAVTSAAVALVDSVPLLIIGGAPPIRDEERFVLQGGVDQVALMAPVTKLAKRVTHADRIPELVDLALRTARTGRPGPVYLEVPIDVMYARTEDDVWIPRSASALPRPGSPSSATVDEVLALLGAAQRPIIFAGHGVHFSGAGEVLRKFAEHTSTPVYSNNRALGALPFGHHLYGGNINNLPSAGQPDLVIALGARLSGLSVGSQRHGAFSHSPRIIQVDIDGAEIGRNFDVAVPVVGDVKVVVDSLLDAAIRQEWPERHEWSGKVSLSARPLESFRQAAADHTKMIHPLTMAQAMVDSLPEDAVLVGDGSECYHWVEPIARISRLGSWLGHGYFGCLGIGMPYAIGAQLAYPDRRVAVIVGDGSVGFNLAEFDTMVRHNLPIMTVVSSNQLWGMSAHGQDILAGERVISELPLTRYDKVAEALGGHGEFVTEPGELAAAFKRALESGRPSCINVVVDPDVVSPRLNAMKATTAKAGDLTDAGDIFIPYYEPMRAR